MKFFTFTYLSSDLSILAEAEDRVQLRPSGDPHISTLCMAFSFYTDGSPVVLAPCVDGYTFVVPEPGTTGQIRGSDGTLCLDVRDGDPTNGNQLQVWSCVDGNTNQLWRVDGPGPDASLSISWAGQNKCVQVEEYAAGDAVQIWDCNSDRRQWWTTSPL
ncbi:ricin B-like lectin [Marasmius fiardii PR-910]|nr:ricin B-like lectin [Marasmius fiardii PR-910]